MVEENEDINNFEEEPESDVNDIKTNFTSKLRQNPWMVTSAVLGILCIIFIALSLRGGVTGNVISEDSAGENLVAFAQSQLPDIQVLSVEKDASGLYKITFTSSKSGESYIYSTLDGKYLISSLIPVTTSLAGADSSQPSQTQPKDIPKSNKPKVELFVMAYCPFGTQAEKAMLPVIELLKDKIDFSVRFVYYAMHPSYGEVEEQLNQYCIQKEQNVKFTDYLSCFLEAGDSEGCLSSTGIDMTKLSSCVAKTDAEFDVTKNLNDKSSWLSGKYPLFNINKDLNEKYSVGGSPTLVVNGVQASSARTSQAYLNLICSTFNTQPSECSQTLSSTTPSSGFGYDTTSASGSDATCG